MSPPAIMTADELLRTNLVWVINPERRLARIYRADGTEAIVTADEALRGDDVVPGFACPLATIL